MSHQLYTLFVGNFMIFAAESIEEAKDTAQLYADANYEAANIIWFSQLTGLILPVRAYISIKVYAEVDSTRLT